MSLTSHQLSSGNSIVRTKLLRIVAYRLCLMLMFVCNRTKTGSIIDPAELEVAQQKLFLLVQQESFSLERKSLLKSPPISKTSTIPKLSLYWTEWTTSRKRTYPSIGSPYIWNKASCDTRCSTSLSPLVPAATTRKTLPSRCRVLEGFDPTELLDYETSHDVKVYSVEVCYMPETKSGNCHTSYG